MFTQNIVKGVKVCQNSCMMEISQVQYERIADCFPVHRGNVAYDNLKVLNAILYVMENGCKWRRLPKVWKLAYNLRAHEPMVQVRCSG